MQMAAKVGQVISVSLLSDSVWSIDESFVSGLSPLALALKLGSCAWGVLHSP